ncbi:MAG: saccharopine dehydrogenase NADP-binding domain-containing protein [Bradymonadales bacterium]|nr:saccharopine dehydrogenase NADP-binding domain-containing protein [Bradymonadales bacterium]
MNVDPSTTKRILVLGAGLVSRPLVSYFLERPGHRVTMASRTVSKAQAIIGDHPKGEARALNVNDIEAVEALVAEHDLAVSLLPADRHVEVARLCLKHGKHMATTSYIRPEMRALDGEAKEKGLTFLNECGVDPGIDHMSAMRIFDRVWDRGGKVVSFKSYCGGLPAPEANDNPLGYKFSWAPRGVLVAARNSAVYLWEGKEVHVPGPQLFTDMHQVEVAGAGVFESYPNRDSLSYIETYGLHGISTMYRGTLRNLGHCARWKAWVDLGLFEVESRQLADRTYAGLLRSLLQADKGTDLRLVVAEKLGMPVDADPIRTLEWLGFFGEDPIPQGVDTPLDALAAAMLERMQYRPGERDMLVMHHDVISQFEDHREQTIMDFVDFGIPHKDSSMARTVTLPCAIGARLILEGTVQDRGVLAPVLSSLYQPILAELETLDIRCVERTLVI